MNASQQSLFERLLAFEIDEPGTELTFARRLAREQGWSLAYTERVIVQYKRFLLLAVAAGHVVTPSEQVDQAWHLHLTYTRSYWNDLCRDVLQQPLHHGPTKGGAAEQGKFFDLYNQTLFSYRRLFGQEPPRDIWSPAEQRFGEDLHRVNVNTARCWIIPKPRWRVLRLTRAPLVAAGVVAVPLATWNPLDWTGPEFLRGFVIVSIAAFLLALVVRLLFRPDESADDEIVDKPLDPYEAACLAAGPQRAVEAAFAALVQSKNLRERCIPDVLTLPQKSALGCRRRSAGGVVAQYQRSRDPSPVSSM